MQQLQEHEAVKSPRSEFSKSVRDAAWYRCEDRCDICKQEFAGRRPEYHHHLEAALGGSNDLENCQVLCPTCHRYITTATSIPRTSKVRRILEKRAGLRRPKQKIQSRGFAR